MSERRAARRPDQGRRTRRPKMFAITYVLFSLLALWMVHELVVRDHAGSSTAAPADRVAVFFRVRSRRPVPGLDQF